VRSALASVLAGGALGASATGGAALLLYTERGFLATAGFLVSLSFAAAGAGVWAGSGEPEPVTAVEAAGGAPRAAADRRRRAALGRAWTAAVLATGAAAAFAAIWLVRPSVRDAAIGGAAAVLFILAGPAYTIGQVLARLGRHRAGVASGALVGAAAGVLAAAQWGIPRLDAPYLFLAAALLIAFAATLAGSPAAAAEAPMNNRTIVVTGAGSAGQLGYALAETFRDAGASVVITDYGAAVEQLAATLGPEVLAVRADLTREDDAQRLIAAVLERFGRLDALINAAGGLSTVATVENTTAEAWAAEIARNATTTFITTRAALPALRRARGAVVCFASPAALQPAPQLAAYSAAKAAVCAFSRALAAEERAHGVRVNVIAPGMIDTDQNRAGASPDTRFVTRAEIAQVALFLASDAARGVSGETIQVLGDTLGDG
jgi:NAD(P)-dependent dehydrogenase (short-subunit alcohol dehydrogenase family)